MQHSRKMNQLVASAVLRRLSGGWSRNSRVFTSTTRLEGKAVTLRPFHDTAVACAGYGWRRRAMSSAAAEKDRKESAVVDKDRKDSAVAEKEEKTGSVTVSSYWGISRPKITREDGIEWPWNCFMPWDTYQADSKIDLSKHHVPKTFLDKVAFRTVKILRIPTDLFFQRRYGCRAMMLETVAAVPGMVGGMLLHLRSLRKFEHSGGWIKALLEEAENERMHLMTMVELVQPKCSCYCGRLLETTKRCNLEGCYNCHTC